MATISSISINLNTASDSGAGTDGDVYVGFGGREFYLDTSADDFERGSSRTYVLGNGANIRHQALNDPRTPQLDDGEIDRYPVYVRFVGTARGDNWKLQRATVTVDSKLFPLYETTLGDGIWMGTRATGVIFLDKHDDGVGINRS